MSGGFELKIYQRQALQALEGFLHAAAMRGASSAFRDATGFPFEPEPFGEACPCVCLRIPTGGGKTLLGAHAVGLLQRDWPAVGAHALALWLVPSDAIRSQTLAALTTPGHPLRAALEQGCGDTVRVCTLEELAQLSPQDFASRAVVVVATIQSFRIDDADKRNVYTFSEAWESHFRSLPPQALDILRSVPDALVTAEDAAREGREMLARYVGQPRRSLANWLALRRPYVIVDEAHNAKTDASFKALRRLNPAAILELTATPLARRSNVLFSVSAQQLRAEHMIKMPISLTEHTQGWQQAVAAAVMRQRQLEAEARLEEHATGQRINPMALLQAQNADQAVTVEALRQHLVEELHIAPAQIRVATGTQRELEGEDLMAPDCPVRFIITVQALKEGWDCPFAYVLCTVQSVRSSVAIEQLLGRVLRMPFARERQREALNRAYAHVTEAETGQAANALADRLIDGMGFNALDLASMLAGPTAPLPGMENLPLFAAAPAMPALSLDLPADTLLPAEVTAALARGELSVQSEGERQRLTLRGAVDEALASALVQATPKKQREQVQQQLERHQALVVSAQAPENRGERLAPLPRLAYRAERHPQSPLLLLEREAVLDASPLNLLAEPVELAGFELRVEQGTQWQIYLNGERVQVGAGGDSQLPLDASSSPVTLGDLTRWLARELQQPARNRARDVLPAHLRAFVRATLEHLLHSRGFPLATLVLRQHELVRLLASRIEALRESGAQRGFRQLVLDGGWALEAGPTFEYRVEPQVYPVSGGKRYAGKHHFAKHYHAAISDLLDGSEEMACALAIEQHPRVLRWVRNLDDDPGFWLPTSSTRFFPDFLCWLADGRVFVVEYKGEQMRHSPKEIEKRLVGETWAAASGGRAGFLFAYRQDQGLGVAAQLLRAF
ncbi:MAG: DEAD/DEAH box helicase family protein [Burkholderiales bacterium]|nr:DEAD/DEAH box helicase family protein [Burkholderiales bacterium]